MTLLNKVRNRTRVVEPAVQRFEFRNKTANAGEIFLYGVIGEDFFGDGITGKTFAKELRGLGNVRTLDVRVDSPGGSVFDAKAIYSLLVEHKAEVTVHIDGVAASAASFIAMAGKNIVISEGGFVMIHEARGVVRGTAGDMERGATLLKSISDTIAQTYVARTGQAKSKVLTWMADETWFDGNDAVKYGFADRVAENQKVAASAYTGDDYGYKNLPAALRPTVARARQIKARLGRTAT